MTTKPVGAAPAAGVLGVEVEVDAATAGAAFVPWRLSSQAPRGMTRDSWSSRPSQAIRPDAAVETAARCACV